MRQGRDNQRAAAATGLMAAVALTVCGALAAQPAAAQRVGVEEATISGIHAAFELGLLSCRELAQNYLDRIRAYDRNGPAINAIATLNADALEQAAALDERWRQAGPAGPLHCIPIVLKDNINTADMPTTSGSAILADTHALADATIVEKLRDAGALILGKATMGELAAGSYSTAHGQQRNPYDTDRETGGSSSGSAAAVAANFAAAGIGTDTYTSVRGPAADTGIVGLRPTTGLISRNGIAPRKAAIDTAGPMTRTVTDAAVLLNVLAGPDPADPRSVDVHASYSDDGKTTGGYRDFTGYLGTDALVGARIGVVRDFLGGDPEIDDLTRDALDVLQERGAVLVDIRLEPALRDPYVRDWIRTLDEILVYAFDEVWEEYLQTLEPGAPRSVAEWIEIYETDLADRPFPPATTGFSALGMMRAALARSSDDPAYRNLIENILPDVTRLKYAIFEQHGVDALVFPYRSTFAPPIDNPIESVDDPEFVRTEGVPSPAVLGGYGDIGFPMIVVPMGFGSQGLPTGLTFMGRPYEEGRLLGYAYAYEQASGMRRPSPLVPRL